MPECACGCGKQTGGGTFLPGHDQKLRRDLEIRTGGLLRLAKLVEAAESYVEGRTSLETLGSMVRAIVQT
jgi:hypothetical protein